MLFVKCDPSSELPFCLLFSVFVSFSAPVHGVVEHVRSVSISSLVSDVDSCCVSDKNFGLSFPLSVDCVVVSGAEPEAEVSGASAVGTSSPSCLQSPPS
jgi:hypothetical protein